MYSMEIVEMKLYLLFWTAKPCILLLSCLQIFHSIYELTITLSYWLKLLSKSDEYTGDALF